MEGEGGIPLRVELRNKLLCFFAGSFAMPGATSVVSGCISTSLAAIDELTRTIGEWGDTHKGSIKQDGNLIKLLLWLKTPKLFKTSKIVGGELT